MPWLKKIIPPVFFGIGFLLIVNFIEPPKSLTAEPWKTALFLITLILFLLSLISLIKTLILKRGFKDRYRSRIPNLSRLQKQR